MWKMVLLFRQYIFYFFTMQMLIFAMLVKLDLIKRLDLIFYWAGFKVKKSHAPIRDIMSIWNTFSCITLMVLFACAGLAVLNSNPRTWHAKWFPWHLLSKQLNFLPLMAITKSQG